MTASADGGQQGRAAKNKNDATERRAAVSLTLQLGISWGARSPLAIKDKSQYRHGDTVFHISIDKMPPLAARAAKAGS
jgi:hypothetical protein